MALSRARFRRWHSTPRTFRIVDRRGRYFADASRRPFVWTEREMMALSFLSKAKAEAFIDRKFGTVAGRELLGLRVVS